MFVQRFFVATFLFIGSLLSSRKNGFLNAGEQLAIALRLDNILALKIDDVACGLGVSFANQVIGNQEGKENVGVVRVLGNPKFGFIGLHQETLVAVGLPLKASTIFCIRFDPFC